MKVRFVRDADLERSIRGSLDSMNPLGTQLRQLADRIRDAARELARADADTAAAEQQALRGSHSRSARQAYLQAKARAWALKRHARMIGAVMDDTDGEVTGQVIANYPGSAAIEFGGPDPNVTIGDTDQPVIFAAHAHLRRALDQVGAL